MLMTRPLVQISATDGKAVENAMRSHIHGSIKLVRNVPDRLFR